MNDVTSTVSTFFFHCYRIIHLLHTSFRILSSLTFYSCVYLSMYLCIFVRYLHHYLTRLLFLRALFPSHASFFFFFLLSCLPLSRHSLLATLLYSILILYFTPAPSCSSPVLSSSIHTVHLLFRSSHLLCLLNFPVITLFSSPGSVLHLHISISVYLSHIFRPFHFLCLLNIPDIIFRPSRFLYLKFPL